MIGNLTHKYQKDGVARPPFSHFDPGYCCNEIYHIIASQVKTL